MYCFICSALFTIHTETQTTSASKKYTHDCSSSVRVVQKLANLRSSELNLIPQYCYPVHICAAGLCVWSCQFVCLVVSVCGQKNWLFDVLLLENLPML